MNSQQQNTLRGTYAPEWSSLTRHETPVWFRDAKFGIFIHWGIFSVPAYRNEWYSRNMYIQGTPEFEHHVKTYGPQKEFGYKDFLPMFGAEKFNAAEWARLFRRAGARYVVPVAEHHDGFQMYQSELSHWNSAEKGPHRDVLGELARACRAEGLYCGASSHRAEHWFFMSHGKEFESDIHEPMQRGDFYWPAMPEANHTDFRSKPTPTDEYLTDWYERCCEIVDRYQPSAIYFDWWIQHEAFEPWIRRFAAYYYNRAEEWGREVTIFYKHDSYRFGSATPDVERGQFAEWKPFAWQTDTSVALNSWCYTEENEYRKANELVQDLVDIVSKNGCLLLNVGPKADGTIAPAEVQILTEIGEWLSRNGEAIYGTRTWKLYGEGPTRVLEGQFTDGISKNFTAQDIRFTTREGRLFATALRGAEDGVYCIRQLGMHSQEHPGYYNGIVHGVRLLATGENLPCVRDVEGLRIQGPAGGEWPVAFEIMLDGNA